MPTSDPLRHGAALAQGLVSLREGDAWIRHLPEEERRLRLPGPAQRRLAFASLRALLLHAQATVPFHRERMRAAGFDPAGLRDAADLSGLPTLSKADIREHAADLLSTAHPLGGLVEASSGGTTGKPVPFLQTRTAVARKHAAALALRRRLGWPVGTRAAYLWGAAQDAPLPARGRLGRWKRGIRTTFVDRVLYRTVSDLAPGPLDEVAEAVERFRPLALQAYPSAADHLARRLLARGRTLRVPLVLLTAEPTFEAQRARVREAFRADVRTFYGARECGWIASECARGALHVNVSGVHLEVAPDGALLVTDLVNDAMPLIRYEIGDRGAWSEGRCACGDPRPVLARLEGRTTDVFRLPSGRRVPGVLCDVRNYHLTRGVLETQIVQREIGRIEVRWVAAPGFVEGDLAVLRRWLSDRFFGEVDLVFVRTDRIPPGPNGKARPCLCLLPPEAEIPAAQGVGR